MRTSKATVRLVLKTSKADPNGECPVHIVVCWKKRVEKSTGLRVHPKYWDTKCECVKKTHKNWKLVNKALEKLLSEAVSRRDALDASGQPYEASDVLGDKPVANDTRFSKVAERYLDETNPALGTRKQYVNAVKKVQMHLGDHDISSYMEGDMKKLAECMKQKGNHDSTVGNVLGQLHTVFAYAKRIGLTQSSPFDRWRYGRRYGKSQRIYTLNEWQMHQVMGLMIDLVGCRWEPGLECYNLPSGYDYVFHRYGKVTAVVYFTAILRLNGIAPVDLAYLKRDNVTEFSRDGVDYWRIEYRRKKTGKKVTCVLKKDDFITQLVFEPYLESSGERNGYIYSIFDKDLPEKLATNRRNNQFASLLSTLKKEIELLNEHIRKSNDPQKLEIDTSQLVYYTARHTVANVYASQKSASLRGLASLMGRSVTGLDTYLHALGHDIEIADAMEVMPI